MTPASTSADLALDNELEFEVEREQDEPPARPPLEKFVPRGGALYEAVEFVLLGSPKRQVMQSGDSSVLEKTADDSAKAGDRIGARINYESAARVALYEQNKEKVRKLLERAEEFTSKEQRFSALHRTLLQNLDEVMRVAAEYYGELEKNADASRGPPPPETKR